jgi:hypothetical protein
MYTTATVTTPRQKTPFEAQKEPLKKKILQRLCPIVFSAALFGDLPQLVF